MTIGLSSEEYFELKLKPRAGADPVFFQAAEQERDGMFPMPLVSVASHLRSRGYDCRPQSLDLLLESNVVSPADSDAWSQDDVDTAAAQTASLRRGECTSITVPLWMTIKRLTKPKAKRNR